MKKIVIYAALGIIMLSLIPLAASQTENSPIITMLVDIDTPPSPNDNDISVAEDNLHKIFDQIIKHHATSTLLLTEDVSSSHIRLLLAQYSVLSDLEFALSGKSSDNSLRNLSLSEQEDLIEKSMKIAKAARVCGRSEVKIMGFMPPGFDQNTDTYKAMDNLDIKYNLGFQEGILFAPGHEEDIWPYPIEGYNFIAAPISSAAIAGELLPLYDKKMSEKGISSSEWAEVLANKLDNATAMNEPIVVLFSTSLSGNGEYFDALKSFLDYGVSKNAKFVSAWELVKMTNSTLETPEMTECTTCGKDNVMNVTITQIENPVQANETVNNETQAE